MNIQYAFNTASFYFPKAVSSETSLIGFVAKVQGKKMQRNKRKVLKKKCSQNAGTKPAHLLQSLS